MSETRILWPKLRRDIVAILRGIKPEETKPIILTLLEAGFEAIEIPLNSPEPFGSIEIARKTADENGSSKCLIGAGTVLDVESVERLASAGGNLVVSPNVNVDVIAKAAGQKMITMPGVFTATEALAAVHAGASGLKFFPASILGPSGIKAISAVLPDDIELAAVGGVSETNFSDYQKVGVKSFGLGSSLYKPSASADEIGSKARNVITAYDAVYSV